MIKYKKVSLLIFATLLFCLNTGCADQQELERLRKFEAKIKAEAELLEANKAVVRRTHDEVWSQGKMEVVDELYSEDYVAHWITGGDTNREELKKMILEARTSFPDMKEEIVHIAAEGDLVITHFTTTGTFLGEMNGIPPTGKKGTRPEIAVHRIKEGKIVEQWTVADLLSLLNQLGIKF